MRFSELKKLRSSDLAVAVIRDRILNGEIGPGQRLPAERELAAQLGVNRTTVREALRSLEQMGLVDIRHGEGAVVLDYARAGLQVLPYLLTLGGQLDPGLLGNFLEVRRVMGVAVTRLAAERAGPEDHTRLAEALANIQAAVDEGETDPKEIGAIDLAFFLALSQATGNRVFSFILHGIRSIYREVPTLFAELFRDVDGMLANHRHVYEAVVAGEVEKATATMERYLSPETRRQT